MCLSYQQRPTSGNWRMCAAGIHKFAEPPALDLPQKKRGASIFHPCLQINGWIVFQFHPIKKQPTHPRYTGIPQVFFQGFPSPHPHLVASKVELLRPRKAQKGSQDQLLLAAERRENDGKQSSLPGKQTQVVFKKNGGHSS